MRLAIICDVFPPLRSSGAVQMRDLVAAFVQEGHDVTVITASPGQAELFIDEQCDSARVLRLKCPPTRDRGYLRRTLAEFAMPYAMKRALLTAGFDGSGFDGVIWYSPTIFLAPLARWIKKASSCNGYLIIRDIFPEWSRDLGIMSNGPIYWTFKAVAKTQYEVADIIGVQTPSNLAYFTNWHALGKRIEVLHNWLDDRAADSRSFDLPLGPLKGRTLFVYSGNMGVAQGVDRMLDAAEMLLDDTRIGFVFVGRGSDALRLAESAKARRLSNCQFFDEIDPDEIPILYRQCNFGLVILDPRHKSHNIPGKFVSYMTFGLPVFALVNPGNDIIDMIKSHGVGTVLTEEPSDVVAAAMQQAIADIGNDPSLTERCKDLAARMFLPQKAVAQIVTALTAR